MQIISIHKKIRSFVSKQTLLIAAIVGGLCLLMLWYRLPSNGLLASYYNNIEWKGQPVFSQYETAINLQTFEKAIQSAHLPSTNISINWSGWIRIDHDGEHHLGTRSDDGSSITIDDTLIVDNGGFHGMRQAVQEPILKKGMHRISVSYFNGAKGYALSVFWKPPAVNDYIAIPPEILFPSNLSKDQRWLALHLSVIKPFLAMAICFVAIIIAFELIKIYWQIDVWSNVRRPLAECLLCVWVLAWIYVWWVLHGGSGLTEMQNALISLQDFNKYVFETVGPMVLRKYIGAW